jgi:hypothetical protein
VLLWAWRLAGGLSAAAASVLQVLLLNPIAQVADVGALPILNGLLLASRTPAYSTSPLLAAYRESMAKYQPGKVLGDVGAGAFVMGALLEKYASKFLANKTVTSKDFLDLLYSLKDEKLGGLLPGITFAHSDDRTQTNRCISPVTLQNGAFVQRGGFVCAPDWKPGT